MTAWLARWCSSPAFPRVLPFAVLILFVAASAFLPSPAPTPPGEFDSRWIYAARALVVGCVLLALWGRYTELRAAPRMTRTDWWLAIISGVAVFAIWIHLDHGWAVLGLPSAGAFDPRRFASQELHLPLTALRLLGLAIVVPVAEELFWRSFLLRWLQQQDFLSIPSSAVGVRALAITSVLFASEHVQWLAGLIAGAVYGWIYVRTGKVWVAVISHAITNSALGIWVIALRDWRFW